MVNMVIFLALLAVAATLFLGLANLMRGGDGNKSQMLMRMRVIAQAVALVVLIGSMFLFGGRA